MRSKMSILRQFLFGITAIVQLLFFPVVTFAETPSPHASSSPPTNISSSSALRDDGYTFNKQTGLWENEQYTWNPETHQTQPKTKPDYSYNPSTGAWDTSEWKYDPTTHKYVDQKSTNVPKNTSQDTTAPTPSTDTKPPVPHKEIRKGSFDLFYNADISNTVTNTAQSGHATVNANNHGGDAISGNSQATATAVSLLQSSWGLQNSNFSSFSSDIHGNVVGDLLLNPDQLDSSSLPLSHGQYSDTDITVAHNGNIENTLTVEARSGNATVSSNTTGGNAQTGNASAVANVLNLISSSISSGKSFIGNITIHGSLEGDILLPENIRSQLLADNPPTTTLNLSDVQNKELLQEFTNQQEITNTVALQADTGEAIVNNNTAASNAKSGKASTNLTLLNLTNRQVIGKNALLVFVNVLGEWVGMIVDSPTGSTTGVLGDENASSATTPVYSSSYTNSSSITNTINVVAKSGDAGVQNNTQAGDALSGDAKASANILNIQNSSFSLADWFGVLFINVLGSWHGSFGVDTVMGDRSLDPPPNLGSSLVPEVNVYKITEADSTYRVTKVKNQESPTPFTSPSPPPSFIETSQILGTTSNDVNQKPPDSTLSEESQGQSFTAVALAPAGIAILIGVALLALERTLRRKNPKSH